MRLINFIWSKMVVLIFQTSTFSFSPFVNQIIHPLCSIRRRAPDNGGWGKYVIKNIHWWIKWVYCIIIGPSHEGYLSKGGKNLLVQYPKRYFRILGGTLFWYKSKEDTVSLGDILISDGVFYFIIIITFMEL